MKCFNADGGCTGFARDGGTHCNSCLANESGRAEFESAALRSARSLQMEHADVNLKRSEDAYRKERASTECAMVGCDVKISSDYTFCLDHKKTGMSYIDEMQKQIETIDALSQKPTKILARGDMMEAAQALMSSAKSDGSTASYYELPKGVGQLQDLISHKDMNAQIGEIFRACYRYGQVEHSERMRDAKKIKFYAEAEIARLEKL